MRVSRPVLVILTAAGVAVAAPSAAGAADAPRAVPFPGRTSGIVVVDHGRAVRPKPRTVRNARHGSFDLVCSTVDGKDGAIGTSGAGGPLHTRSGVPIPHRADYCIARLTIQRSSSTTSRPIGAVATTAAGRDYLYELAIAGTMSFASDLVLSGSDAGPVSVADLVTQISKGVFAAGHRLRGVATPAPDTPVAADEVGIWTDGNRVSVTATTPAGRHLYLDYDTAGRAISTNILGALQDEATGSSGSSAARPLR